MELRRTSRRAERVDALLRGLLPVETTDDRQTLAVADALNSWPAPTLRPEFRATLRTRLLTEAGEKVASDQSPDSAAATQAAQAAPAAPIAPAVPEAPAAPEVPGTRGTQGTQDAQGARRRRPAPRFARPALVGALASAVAAVGVTVGARGAMPGEPLYSVKLHVEQIEVSLAGSETDRAKAHLDLARNRMGEMQSLVDASGTAATEEIPELLAAWHRETTSGSDVLVEQAQAGDSDARQTMTEFTTEQSENLTNLVGELPDPDTQVIAQQALDYIEILGSSLGPATGGSPQPSAPSLPSGSPTATEDVTTTASPSPSASGDSPVPTLSTGDTTTSASASTATASATTAPGLAPAPTPTSGSRPPTAPPTPSGLPTVPSSDASSLPRSLPSAAGEIYSDAQQSIQGLGSDAAPAQ